MCKNGFIECCKNPLHTKSTKMSQLTQTINSNSNPECAGASKELKYTPDSYQIHLHRNAKCMMQISKGNLFLGSFWRHAWLISHQTTVIMPTYYKHVKSLFAWWSNLKLLLPLTIWLQTSVVWLLWFLKLTDRFGSSQFSKSKNHQFWFFEKKPDREPPVTGISATSKNRHFSWKNQQLERWVLEIFKFLENWGSILKPAFKIFTPARGSGYVCRLIAGWYL